MLVRYSNSCCFVRRYRNIGILLEVPTTVPEIIDPVFAKTSQNARFLLSENERFGLVFVKTGSINSDTGKESPLPPLLNVMY
jgi:hypothetical protein